MKRSQWLGTAAVVAATGLIAAGCGSSSSSSTTQRQQRIVLSTSSTSASTTAASSSVFGTPKKATGSPYVFGMINDETGAVTFPEARQGAIAAMDYVNDYLGGINGHPIVIDNCIGDGTPATAARCANELVAKHPLAILGAADVGAPASIPIYAHANLAYIGGIPFTPGAVHRAELDPVLVGERRRQRRGRRVRGQDARRQERGPDVLLQSAGRVDHSPDRAGVQGRRRDHRQDDPALADFA